MDTQKRAHSYFRLGDQYAETSKLLLETLIQNGNSTVGTGCTAEEAMQKSRKNSTRSDLYLFIPAVFNCLQCTELFIKGLILLAGKENIKTHDVERLLVTLQDTYPSPSDIPCKFQAFYNNQINIIEAFKKTNNLSSSTDLYMALRYPEITLKQENRKQNVIINYIDLIHNGNVGIEQFQVLANNLNAVKAVTLKEYQSKSPL